MVTATETPGTDLQPLVAAQGVTRDTLTVQAIAIATAAVRSFDDWYDPDAITKWAAALAKAIEPILRVLARNTDAYAARSVAAVSRAPFRPVGAINVGDLRSGITHAGAFARAADVYRYQQYVLDQTARAIAERVSLVDGRPVIGDGVDGDGELLPPDVIDPLDAALNRATAVADQDTSLVVQQQARATFTAASRRGLITGWRRVIHPELSEGGTCGLCVAASTRIYRVEDLMPIHERCKCVPAAVRGDADPGAVLNDADLKRLYDDAGSTSAADLKRTRYRVDDHGNLGPVLVAATSKRRTDPGRGSSSSSPAKTALQRREAAQRLRDQLTAILPKAKALAVDDPKKWGPYYQKLEARIVDLGRQLA